MPFLEPPEYDYTYDKSISSPLDRRQNKDGEVRRIQYNMRPISSFSKVNEIIAAPDNKQKYIYTMRHGKAKHNAMAKEYTKPISWRFLPKLRDNFDPSLTPEGFEDAQNAGNLLRELIQKEDAPKPKIVYTSPLKRCIQTAMYAISSLQLDHKVTLRVREGLREWKGFDHDHQSDRRDITPNILKLFNELKQELCVDVDFEHDGEQEDEDELVMQETYVDVDRRIRSVLDDIFHSDKSDCCILVLHNRSNKSVLRVMGHNQDEVHKLDMENCAVLGYLVKRELMLDAAAENRLKNEEKWSVQDKALALQEKKERHDRAVKDIEGYWQNKDPKLQNLRDYLVYWTIKGDGEAFKALIDLYSLAPEMMPAGVKVIDRCT